MQISRVWLSSVQFRQEHISRVTDSVPEQQQSDRTITTASRSLVRFSLSEVLRPIPQILDNRRKQTEIPSVASNVAASSPSAQEPVTKQSFILSNICISKINEDIIIN